MRENICAYFDGVVFLKVVITVVCVENIGFHSLFMYIVYDQLSIRIF